MIYGPKQFRESLAVIYTPESGRLTDVQGPAATDQQLGRHHPHQQLNNPRHLADPVNPQNEFNVAVCLVKAITWPRIKLSLKPFEKNVNK